MPKKTQKLLKELTILYVEDEESLRTILNEVLIRDFKEVYHAGNGKKGFEIFKEKHPDIVITDVNMPVMDGFEMTKKILLTNPNTPIIFTTAFDVNQLNSMTLPGSLFFFKPVDIRKLLSTLSEIAENIFEGRAQKFNFENQIG